MKLPVLIIIPHGGRNIPDELSEYEIIDDFGIFIESDPYANEIFNIPYADVKINSQISRLFVDLDRPPGIPTSSSEDAIIKTKSPSGRKIFKENFFPDEIAASNIMKRYYEPFHSTIQKAIKSGEIRLILDCHTMMPVGPRYAMDAGKPRPLLNLENIIKSEERTMVTCPAPIAENFLSCFKKYFSGEEYTVTEKFSMNNPETDGYILREYGRHKIPMIKFSISTSLFLNDKYFNYDNLSVDPSRIEEIRKRIAAGIEKFASKYL